MRKILNDVKVGIAPPGDENPDMNYVIIITVQDVLALPGKPVPDTFQFNMALPDGVAAKDLPNAFRMFADHMEKELTNKPTLVSA